MMDPIRYAPQILVPEIGVEGQQKIGAAKVLVVGAGGLGCPALLYLTGLGCGTIGIADDDTVSLSNLHRQVLYTEADAGKAKAVIAREYLQQRNGKLNIVSHPERLTELNAAALIGQYDMVVDCSDNIDTRYIIDAVTSTQGKPFVYGGIRRFEGQVAVFNYRSSCSFTAAFPDKQRFAAEQDCATAGIVGYTAGVVACLQVNEVLKCILGLDGVLAGEILTIDLRTLVSRKWKLAAG